MLSQSLIDGRFAGLHAGAVLRAAELSRGPLPSGSATGGLITNFLLHQIGTTAWIASREEDIEYLFMTMPPEWQHFDSIYAPTELMVCSDWSDTEQALWELGQLGDNWDNEGSAGADWRSIRQAMRFLNTFRGLGLDWYPSLHADGRAMLEAHPDGGRAYFLFGPGSQFIGLVGPHGQLPPAAEMSMGEAGAMNDLSARLKSLSVLV